MADDGAAGRSCHLYLTDDDTLSSALRPILEERNPHSLVSCRRLHAQDPYVRVQAPSAASVRAALEQIREQLAAARDQVVRQSS